MTKPIARLLEALDFMMPSTGIIGYIALINGNTFTSTTTLDSATGLFTTPTANLYVTGTRIRLTNSGGALPGVSSGAAINTSTDYFVTMNAGTSATTYRLARTLADAQAGTTIAWANNGTGTHTVTEQQLNATATNPDPLNVVLSKELPNAGGYSARIPINNIGAAQIVNNRAEKNITFTLTGDSTGYIYRYYQIIMGGTSAIGNTTGNQGTLIAESSNVTVNSGTPKPVFLRDFLSSP
jgi:plastocyanin